jgi:predicted acetyltransferase
MAGYSPVGVAPAFRGQGLAARITATHYPVLRERGEVIAGLFPATTRLYRTVGFELAAVWSDRAFPIRSLQTLPPSAGVSVRRATLADLPAMKATYAATARWHPGWLDRPDVWWQQRLADVWDERQAFVVDGTAGEVAGYIVYRQSPDPARTFGYQINVGDLVTDDVDVACALWRLVGSASSMVDTVTTIGPPEHPLLLLLREQDVVARSEIRYMLRVVDAPGAVAARGYPPVQASIDIELTDRHCDWNAGRWRLVVDAGEGRLEKGGSGAVRMSINAFAALYAGYASSRSLARAGHLAGAGHREHALLDAVLTGPTPTLMDFF